jgi:RNase P subunit RPR2
VVNSLHVSLTAVFSILFHISPLIYPSFSLKSPCSHMESLMDLYEELPAKINSKIMKDLPLQIIERIRFLWKASYKVLDGNITSNSSSNKANIEDALHSSHEYSRKFMHSVLNHGIHLPQSYLQRLCEKCCILQLPSLTCRSRLKPRTKKSKCNRSADQVNHHESSKCHMKNQLIRTCLVCSHITRTQIGCKRGKTQPASSTSTPHQPSEAKVSLVAASPAAEPLLVMKPTVTPSSKGFSFHDIMKNSSATSQPSEAASETVTTTASTSAERGSGKRYLTLIEREQSMKKMKKKQKRMSEEGNQSTSSLASIRNIFSSSPS